MLDQIARRLKMNLFYLCLSIFILLGSYEAKACIPRDTLVEISKDFIQFRDLISQKENYCRDEIGKEVFGILHMLKMIKELDLKSVPEIEGDELTLSPISHDSWWNYLVENIDRFEIGRKDK